MSLARLKWAAILSFLLTMAFVLIGGLFANRQVPPTPNG